jgi:hypothetical protein
MAYAVDEALSEELGEEAGTRVARETRNQQGRSEVGSDQLAMVETSAAQAIQRAIRARQGTRSSITPEQRSRANARASLLRLFVRERVHGMTEAKAIEQLNHEEFGGQNRGLALTIYHDFHWRDRTEKFKLFRKIADAVGLKHAPSELGPPFPASCFQNVKRAGRNLAEEARQMSAAQEAGFGRQRFGLDDEGHRVPIDESR